MQTRPSNGGKDNLGMLIEDCRDRVGITDWGVFADWLTQQSELFITKDLIYKTFRGNYQMEPAMRVCYALVQSKEFIFRKSKDGKKAGKRITMEDIAAIIYDRCDIYGNSMQPPIENGNGS